MLSKILSGVLLLLIVAPSAQAQYFVTKALEFDPLPNDTVVHFEIQVDSKLWYGPDTLLLKACCGSTVIPAVVYHPTYPLTLKVAFDTHGLSCLMAPETVLMYGGDTTHFLDVFWFYARGLYDRTKAAKLIIRDTVIRMRSSVGPPYYQATAQIPVVMDSNSAPRKIRVSGALPPFYADSSFYPICYGATAAFQPTGPGHFIDTLTLHDDHADTPKTYQIVLIGDAYDAAVKTEPMSRCHFFPNPATDHVTFDPRTPESFSLSFIDYLGREVLQTGRFSGESQIDIRSLRSGVYFVRCSICGSDIPPIETRLIVTRN